MSPPGPQARARQAYAAYDDLRFAVDRALLSLDRGRDRFEADPLLHAAAEAVWVRLAEVHRRLGGEAEDIFPEFPSRTMREMRNILVHRYPSTDYDLVWRGLHHVAALGVLLEQRMALQAPDRLASLQHDAARHVDDLGPQL